MPRNVSLKFGSGAIPPRGSRRAGQMRGHLWGMYLKGWMGLRWKKRGEEGEKGKKVKVGPIFTY